MGYTVIYPLVNVHTVCELEAMALIEIDGLPNLKMVIFYSYVKLPEGIYIVCIYKNILNYAHIYTIYIYITITESCISIIIQIIYVQNCRFPE